MSKKIAKKGWLILAVCFVAEPTLPTWAGSFDTDAKRCEDSKTDPDLRIGACTALLQSGELAEGSIGPVFRNRGTAYHLKGDIGRAIEDFDQAIRANPKDTAAFTSRGYAYHRKGLYDRAIEDFNEAIALRPMAFIYERRGTSYLVKRDYQRALEDLNRAIHMDSTRYLAYLNRGLTYFDLNDYDHAVADFNSTLKLRPSYIRALFWRGRAYVRSRKFDLGIKDFNGVLESKPNDSGTYYFRAIAFEQIGKTALALRDYKHVTRLKPNDASAYNGAAWLLATSKEADVRDGAQAVELARRAVSLKPGNLNYIDTLAAAYAANNQFDKAVAEQEKAIAILRKTGEKSQEKLAKFQSRLDLYRRRTPYTR